MSTLVIFSVACVSYIAGAASAYYVALALLRFYKKTKGIGFFLGKLAEWYPYEYSDECPGCAGMLDDDDDGCTCAERIITFEKDGPVVAHQEGCPAVGKHREQS